MMAYKFGLFTWIYAAALFGVTPWTYIGSAKLTPLLWCDGCLLDRLLKLAAPVRCNFFWSGNGTCGSYFPYRSATVLYGWMAGMDAFYRCLCMLIVLKVVHVVVVGKMICGHLHFPLTLLQWTQRKQSCIFSSLFLDDSPFTSEISGSSIFTYLQTATQVSNSSSACCLPILCKLGSHEV